MAHLADPEPTEADLERALAENGLAFDPADRAPILTIARFLQRAASRVRRFEDDGAGAGS